LATPFDFIVDEHFSKVSDPSRARMLFKKSIGMVELEVFSFCNRRCWFCPNSSIDRRSTNTHMDEALYLQILCQLGEIGYSGIISFSRYNEPLADRIILKRLAQAAELAPMASLHSNTNGDYLTEAYLEELYLAGLRSLSIQAYGDADDPYDHEKMKARLRRIVQRLNLTTRLVKEVPGEWFEEHAMAGEMSIRIYSRNFLLNGCNRGNTLPIHIDFVRCSPCLSPFHHLYVDYSGAVMPCCNLRSDVDSHRPFVVSNLCHNSDIFAAYSGSDLVQWRRSLIGFSEKSGVCRTCRFDPYESSETNIATNEKLVRSFI
jgi:hypothetical protein